MRTSVMIVLFLVALSIPVLPQNLGYDVDALPTNIGGKSEFKRVFEQQLIYPSSALKKKIGGKVTINFVVMSDRTVSNVNLISSGNADIDKEAMRLFKLYQWVPAIKDGKYINYNLSVSFDFDPDKYSKICYERGFVNFKYLKDFKIESSGNNQYFEKWKIDSTEKLYPTPDQFPRYPKGDYALQDFIKENLEYPRQAQLSNLQGTVLLRFVVEPSGLVTNIGVEKPLGGGCDQEAVRILEMIKWYPGIFGDKLVRVQMKLPIHFVLDNEFKDNSMGEQK